MGVYWTARKIREKMPPGTKVVLKIICRVCGNRYMTRMGMKSAGLSFMFYTCTMCLSGRIYCVETKKSMRLNVEELLELIDVFTAKTDTTSMARWGAKLQRMLPVVS